MPNAVVRWRSLHARQKEIYKQLGPKNVLRCGRRFGKTDLLETTFSKRAIRGRKVGWFTPDYKLMRPTYSRLYRLLAGVIAHASKTEAIIELQTGGLIEFWTLDNEDAGRSRDYDDAVIDEASLIKKGLKEIVEQAIMPTLLDRRGTLTMAGTPKGVDPDNYFYTACTDPTLKYDIASNPYGFREFYAPTRENPTLDPVGVANLQNEYPPLVYQQEYLAEFVDWNGVAFFPRSKLLYEDQPVSYPTICDTVFAVIDSATKTGRENDGTAVLYCAYIRSAPNSYQLVILDYDIQQIEGSLLETWLPSVFRRLEELARLCRSRHGSSGAWIEDKASGMVLLQQAARRSWPARPIDSKLTSVGKSERAINISGYVHQEKVKLSQHAFDKVVNYKGVTRNHLLSQVVGFRIGVKDQIDDDLLDTFCYAVALSLGNFQGF